MVQKEGTLPLCLHPIFLTSRSNKEQLKGMLNSELAIDPNLSDRHLGSVRFESFDRGSVRFDNFDVKAQFGSMPEIFFKRRISSVRWLGGLCSV